MFDKAIVNKIINETDDSVVVSLNVPIDRTDAYRYIQGQNLTLIKEIEGEEIRRSYSICSSVNDSDLRVGIKRVEGGKFSTWANNNLRAGDQLGILPPSGSFYTQLHPDNELNYVGIAAGSGITPILSILKTILESEPRSTFTLLYGNKRTDTIMFLEEIEALKNIYKERFSVFNILSQEIQNADILNGRIDALKVEHFMSTLLPVSQIHEVFLCGPLEMVVSAEKTFISHGIDKSNIHTELFGVPAAESSKDEFNQRELSKEEAENESTVVVMLDGKGTQLKLARGGETILDAALKVRKELPFACKGGVCATCKAKVVRGSVEMDLNYSLTQEEIDQNFTLTCQAHPVSDDVLIDFDQK